MNARARGRWCAWLVCVAALLLTVAFVGPASAAAPYVDSRVSAIPAPELVSKSLQTLADPRRQQAAHELQFDLQALFFVWAFSQIIALVALWRSGASARLRDFLRRTVRNPFLVRFLFGAAVATAASLATLPASVLRYHTGLIYDLDHEPASAWLQRALESWLLNAVAFGALAAFVYTLVARTRLWYLYALPVLFAFVLAVEFVQPVAVLPLFDRVRPLNVVAFGSEVVALERRAGATGIPFVLDESSTRSALATASIVGFGPTKRIVLSDTLMGRGTDGEVLFVIAREVGHYMQADRLRSVLAETIAFVLAIALGVLAADRVAFRRDDDALSRLPLVAAMLGIAALVLLPAYHAYTRGLEVRADRDAVALTRDRASAVRYVLRLADEGLMPVCASPFQRFYFLSTPPAATRAAMVLGRPDPCP